MLSAFGAKRNEPKLRRAKKKEGGAIERDKAAAALEAEGESIAPPQSALAGASEVQFCDQRVWERSAPRQAVRREVAKGLGSPL